jgi:FKBP-type peptidyl-prolyl cis-trans isomerase FkpA
MPCSMFGRVLSLSLTAVAPLVAQTMRAPISLDSAQFAPALGVDLSQSERVTSALYRREIVVGTGAELRVAATATFRIRTVRADGTPVSTSDAPVTVSWYPGVFVDGVERGVRGMRVGGHRQLVLGPGAGGTMPKNAVVVVEVELLQVN